MKKKLRYLAGVAVGAVVALSFSSCAYDPYYSTSVGGSYSSGGGGGYRGGGYGDGYGYGGSSFSTSFFVGTGDPRWGYDPECYSYYDYNRRSYYDPYLNGYYPIGYRPQVVYGAPHPYGWHRGGGYISPPRRVTNGTVVDYRDRESRYRNSGYGWASQVRRRPVEEDRRSEQRGSQRGNSQDFDSRQREASRTSFQRNQPQRQSFQTRQENQSQRQSFQTRQENDARASFQRNQPSRQNLRALGQQERGREQSRYNSPVNSRQQEMRKQDPGNRQDSAPRSKSNKGRNLKDEDKRIQGYR